jgi:DNA-binding MarR family transcriptional regulator
MNEGTVNLYSRSADKLDRDPYGPDGSGRAVVVNGRGFKTWARFHPGEEWTWVQSPADGRMYGLTRTQLSVYSTLRTMADTPLTFRSVAESLGLSPSTITRAAIKLQSFGLIAFVTGRGRYSRTLVMLRTKADGLTRFQEAAKAKVRRWSQLAAERLSRTKFNVALYSLDGRRGVDSLYYYFIGTKSATLNREWSAEEIAETLG